MPAIWLLRLPLALKPDPFHLTLKLFDGMKSKTTDTVQEHSAPPASDQKPEFNISTSAA